MKTLQNKRIVLGITGGIAAYKSPDIVRRLREAGAEVAVVMTQAAKSFITPLTLQAVSGKRVQDTLLSVDNEAVMSHIELARWADIILIAPASAEIITRLVQGHADDLLTTLCLASTSPLLLAPAMNVHMWENAVTQKNITLLKERGVVVLGPAIGSQACGDTGLGRMLEPDAIVGQVALQFETEALAGKTVLVTAGPTHEMMDPVRYFSNRSSGKMGYALAQAASEAGANVILISGPTALCPPDRVEIVNVVSGMEMHAAVMARIHAVDIFISAAAVSDYRPVEIALQKIKKTEEKITFSLIKNPDILLDVACLQKKPLTVGFSAETHAVIEHATQKLKQKKCDMMVANSVGVDHGVEVDALAATLLFPVGDPISISLMHKTIVARKIIHQLASMIE